LREQTPLLLIDDEANARGRLRRLLKDDERVEVIGEAKDGLEAVTEIQPLQPDLLFLDVQMPGLSGFRNAKALAIQTAGSADHLRHWLSRARHGRIRCKRIPANHGRLGEGQRLK
jgi:DNA-binding NarL/FixJ family response regulator